MTAPQAILRFAGFAIDTRRHILTRDGKDVPLSPHLVDILIHLASHTGEVVSKDALLNAFWPDLNVTENTLTRAIADIRRALGDDPAAPQFIQTVARRGYRFIGNVDTETAEDSSVLRGHQSQFGARDDPFHSWVRGRLSLEALDASKLPAALAIFEHAVAASPNYAPAHAALANACFLQFERTRAENVPDREPLNRAINHARRACELDPALGEAWATLGFVLTAAGEIEEAGAAARRASALEPTSWRHQFRLGIASWGEERLRAVDRTLTLLPGFAPARLLAAMVFTARQAFGPALESASLGAQAQTHDAESDGSPFPPIGLHWLKGLLLLRDEHVGAAILEFAREIDDAQRGRIYADEFRVNAQIAAGFAHLSVDDAAGAADAFRSALATLPHNGRALIGLYQALRRTSFAAEASHHLMPQIDRSISELVSGQRLAEAAMVRAALQTAKGNIDEACRTLRGLLETAPPGQTGWIIPIDPSLASLRSAPAFHKVVALLAARAA